MNRLNDLNAFVAGRRKPTPAKFRARIDVDIARWVPVIAAAKIRIN